MIFCTNFALKVTILLLLIVVQFCFIGCNCRNDIIQVDVCVIGGGASGTHAAIELQKAGKSVAVIEKENVMGGHTNTYVDPKTNQSVNYGVQDFENIDVVKDYFKHLNINWELSTFGIPPTQRNFDFSTGNIVEVSHQDKENAYAAYMHELGKYPTIQPGYFIPEPIPDDLLLPFGEFLDKYPAIKAAADVLYLFAQGAGDFLNLPTLNVLKLVGVNIMNDFFGGFIVPTSRDNSQIYRNAFQMLNGNVFLESRLIRVDRANENKVEVTIETPNGQKIIEAKKILVSIPPKVNNLDAFDLNSDERSIFSKFKNSSYYTSLLSNTGLNGTFSIANANPREPYQLPKLPGVYTINPTGVDGLFDVRYGSSSSISDDNVKLDILASLNLLAENGIAKKTAIGPTFEAFNSHTPFELTVSAEDIREGFYEKLYKLQGKYNTFWTGAAFHVQQSGGLWNFTKYHVLPNVLESLHGIS